jgi:energy-coupling factor transporter transmembrane protein EcfT
MAELTTIAYRHWPTPLHRLDARVKVLALLGMGMFSWNAGPLSLAAAVPLAVYVFGCTHVKVADCLHEMRYFMLLLVGVFVSRALATSGAPVLQWSVVSISREGLFSGALFCWRLALVAVLCMGLTVTTRPAQIRAAIEWLLRPVPWLPRRKLGTMIGLLVRFVPVILTQAHQVAEAQRARAVENRRNPVFRATCLAMPLIRRTFVTAERLAMAMEARCYTEDPTPFQWKAVSADWVALGAAGLLCVLMVVA